jgi:hypothetical protein
VSTKSKSGALVDCGESQVGVLEDSQSGCHDSVWSCVSAGVGNELLGGVLTLL